MNRREVVAGLVAMTGFGGRQQATGNRQQAPTVLPSNNRTAPRAGRLKQSVSYWPYGKIPLAEFARECRKIGLPAIDLLQPEEWPVVRDAGLVCSMGYPSKRRGGDFIATGFNDPARHDLLVEELERTLPLAAAAGVPNLIAMFGNRKGRSDEEGAVHCITGLRRVAASAERHGVTICVELLNSKVDHKDYMGDRTGFGVRVIEGVGSPRVKLLYDIYHMQIMEGDVIRTIRDSFAHIGHFHTGGVPGRHELDDTQELNWRTVCRAIADRGFTGYLAHEFVPTRDPMTSLREAFALCDV
jgi:hydroxypyruvate isomerase